MVAIMFFSCVLFGTGESFAETETSLVDAIQQFNKLAANDPIGSSQPPLTEDEIVAAIRFWNDREAPISAEMRSAFKEIAETGVLPGNAAFDQLTGYDRGDDHIFDIWSVRVRLDRPDGTSFAFILRETLVASRTLKEELNRLQASWNGERDLGQVSVEHRIKELEQRIENSLRRR